MKNKNDNAEVIPGVGKNTRTLESDDGTKQADLPYAFHYLDPQALFAMARVMHEAAEKYGPPEGNWRKISIEDHLNHMISHAYAYLAGDRSDDHLAHMACRAMGALQVSLQKPAVEIIPVNSQRAGAIEARRDQFTDAIKAMREQLGANITAPKSLRDQLQVPGEKGITIIDILPSCRVCSKPMKKTSTSLICMSYYCFGHGILTIPSEGYGAAAEPVWDGINNQ